MAGLLIITYSVTAYVKVGGDLLFFVCFVGLGVWACLIVHFFVFGGFVCHFVCLRFCLFSWVFGGVSLVCFCFGRFCCFSLINLKLPMKPMNLREGMTRGKKKRATVCNVSEVSFYDQDCESGST